MLTRSRKLDIVFVAILATVLFFGLGFRIGYTWTGNTNTLSPGFLEVTEINATGYYWNSANRTILLQGQNGTGATAFVGFDANLDYLPNYWVCDGVADDVQIQSAISYCNNTGGGTTYLERGNYDISAPIIIAEKIGLIGAGIEATTLTLATNVNDDVIKYEGTGPVYWCMIKDMEIHANKDNNIAGRGIHINNQFNDGLIENVFVLEASEEGIRLEQVWGWRVINSVVEFCDGTGVSFAGGTSGKLEFSKLNRNGVDGAEIIALGCSVQGCEFGTNNRYGAYILGDYTVFVGNRVNDNVNNGIHVGTPSTDNEIVGNIVYENEVYGLSINGERNSIIANTVRENHQHGIYLNAQHGILNNNMIYHNGADANNTYDGIILSGIADNCTLSSNRCFSDGSRQRNGITLQNGAVNCIIMGNFLSLNAANGIGISANNNDCSITGNTCLSNGVFGIDITTTTCLRNLVKDNILRLNGNAPLRDSGTNSRLATLTLSFLDGTQYNSTNGEPWGWQIDAGGEYASTVGALPLEVQQVVRWKVFATSIVAEGDAMKLEIVGRGMASNETFTTESVDIANKSSTTTNFALDDGIYWTLTTSDDPDIDDFLGGDMIMIKILHEVAAGADCGTEATFLCVEIEYV